MDLIVTIVDGFMFKVNKRDTRMMSGFGIFIINFEYKQLTIVTKNSNLDVGAIANGLYVQS